MRTHCHAPYHQSHLRTYHTKGNLKYQPLSTQTLLHIGMMPPPRVVKLPCVSRSALLKPTPPPFLLQLPIPPPSPSRDPPSQVTSLLHTRLSTRIMVSTTPPLRPPLPSTTSANTRLSISMSTSTVPPHLAPSKASPRASLTFQCQRQQ